MAEDSLNDQGLDAEAQGTQAGPEGGDDMARLEALIARDEALEARSRTADQTRQANGRFAAGDKNGQRQAERNTPEIISAREAKAKAGADPETKARPTTNDPDKQSTPNEPKPDAAPATPTDGDGETGEAGGSKYQRAKEREAKAWKEINARKAELELERAAIESEKQAVQTLRAQRQERPAAGAARHTAQEYQQAASTWQQQARELEAQGDFAGADEKIALAKAAQEQAAEMTARSAGNGAAGTVSLETSWQRLKQDMPEVLHQGSAANKELLAMLKAKPELLADGLGPYRAMLLAGRKLLAGQETELTRQKAEASKVPGLQKQIAELSAQIRELQEATSLPGADPNLNRGSGAKAFGDLSTSEMEARLEREFASSL